MGDSVAMYDATLVCASAAVSESERPKPYDAMVERRISQSAYPPPSSEKPHLDIGLLRCELERSLCAIVIIGVHKIFCIRIATWASGAKKETGSAGSADHIPAIQPIQNRRDVAQGMHVQRAEACYERITGKKPRRRAR